MVFANPPCNFRPSPNLAPGHENTQRKKQATVATGVSLQLIYLHHYDMWAVFYPLFTELAFILYLAGLKLYFEHHLFGVGRGGRDRPFVSRKGAGLSSSDDYSVIGGDDGSSERASLVGSSVAEAGGGEGVGVADGEGSGEETAADDSEGQELEGAEKGRPANTGDEVSCCCCCDGWCCCCYCWCFWCCFCGCSPFVGV